MNVTIFNEDGWPTGMAATGSESRIDQLESALETVMLDQLEERGDSDE